MTTIILPSILIAGRDVGMNLYEMITVRIPPDPLVNIEQEVVKIPTKESGCIHTWGNFSAAKGGGISKNAPNARKRNATTCGKIITV